jgi:hypothetical protein
MARILLSELRDVDWPSALRFLTREDVPKSVEEKAIAAIQADTDRRERRDAERVQEWRRLTERSRNVLRGSRRTGLSKDQLTEATTVVRETRKKYPGFEPFEPSVEKEEPSITIGSLEATVVPPYDFSWTYELPSGPVKIGTTARKSDGYLFCDVQCPDPSELDNIAFDESNGVARAALGIFFQPVVNGKVKFGAHPGPLIYFWYTDCILCDVKSRGAVGLQVYRFKLDGTLDPSPSNSPVEPAHDYFATTDTELWYSDSSDGSHDGAVSPWMAIEFDVSKNRFYNLWVYTRVNAHSDGANWDYAGAARAEMNGFLPKMKWKFVT